MAKSSTRRVTIYINGKEVEASVKQIRAEMNKLVNEQNRMVIGSDEYIAHAKKIKELRQYLKEHAQNIGSAASAWTEMYNKVQQFVEAADIINVSMGDVLGDDATLAIGKMVDVYKKSTDMLKDYNPEHFLWWELHRGIVPTLCKYIETMCLM